MEMWVQSLASLSGLRIWHCLSCGVGQMWLRSRVAMAVVWASSCSSESTPNLGTSICFGCGPKKQKTKQQTKNTIKVRFQLCLFFKKFILSKHCWFPMLYYFQVCSKVIQLYIYTYVYIYTFSYFTGYWIKSPVLYSRTLLFLHPIYNKLPLLILNSQSFSSLPLSPLVTANLFSMSGSLFLFHR